MIGTSRVRLPAGAAREFSSLESTFRADSYKVSVPPLVLPQWHVRDPGYSAKSAGGRLHRNTHAAFTQRNWNGLIMLSSHSVGTYYGNELSPNSSETLFYSRLSSLNHCGLILA